MAPKIGLKREKREEKGEKREEKGEKRKKREKKERKGRKKKKGKEGEYPNINPANRRVEEVRLRTSEPPICSKIVPFYDYFPMFWEYACTSFF